MQSFIGTNPTLQEEAPAISDCDEESVSLPIQEDKEEGGQEKLSVSLFSTNFQLSSVLCSEHDSPCAYPSPSQHHY